MDIQHRPDRQEHDEHDDEHADDAESDQRQTKAALLRPQHRILRRMGIQHGPDEHGDAQIDSTQRDGLADPRHMDGLPQQRQQHRVTQNHDTQHQHAIEYRSFHIAAQEHGPVAVLLLDALLLVGVALQLLHQLLRQQPFKTGADPIGALDEERCGQRGDDRYRDDDGIDVVRDDAQRQTQRRDDEREFADLRQRAAAVDGLPQRVARQQHAQRGKQQLPHDGHRGQYQDGPDVLYHGAGIQHHTHRDEEYRAEQVFNAGGQVFHPLGVDGACQQRTGQKRAQRRGEAKRVRQKHHAEADAQRHDKQRLVAHQLGRLVQQRRQQEDAQHQPQHQIQHQQSQLQRQCAAGDGLTDGDGGQDDHHEDARDILHHQRAEHQLGEVRFPDVQFIESLDDDGGGRHGQHAAQEDAVHGAPAHKLSHGEHAAHLHQRCDDGGAAHAGQLVEVELQSQAEHQDDDADLAPCGHCLDVSQREE